MGGSAIVGGDGAVESLMSSLAILVKALYVESPAVRLRKMVENGFFDNVIKFPAACFKKILQGNSRERGGVGGD